MQKVSSYLKVSSKTIMMAKLKMDTEITSHAQCKSTLNSVADALYVIGGKWKLRIIVTLLEGNRRFNEMQRLIDGISAKMLSSELKDLELNGFVRRTVFTGTPVVVEYELTEYAGTLSGVLQELSAWGAQHKEIVKKSMHREEASVN